MTVLPTIDGIATALSLLLAALASLRAASRLEQRLSHDGSIGLMDGPPILGPVIIQHQQHETSSIMGGEQSQPSPLEEGIEVGENNEEDDDREAVEASPLWEHTEAFRRAVILGLMFEDRSCDSNNNILYDNVFSDVIENEGESIRVRGGSEEEDLALVAAVNSGLLLPSHTTKNHVSRHRVRGGGGTNKYFQTMQSEEDVIISNNNPINILTSWFIRELSAPLAAVPAWHGLLCSYLREQKETKLRESQWCLLTKWERMRYLMTGTSSGRVYDPSGLDFHSSISAKAAIPCDGRREDAAAAAADADLVSSATKAVRVKAFAPRTFRDLRNKCFRVSESEYARSILNAMDGMASMNKLPDNGAMTPSSLEDDSTISDILKEICSGKSQSKMGRRRKNIQTLPYISFQSNSKGAARAGTFFFFTADGAYMIKTVKKEEANAFLEMLPEYHEFFSDGVNNRNSLLTRIFGMYSVQFPSEADAQSPTDARDKKWDGGLFSSSSHSDDSKENDERVYLVMHSVFPPEASAFITERFDLKGSTVGRECSLEERRTKGANAVLKDLDLKREVAEELNAANGIASSVENKNKRSRYGIHVGKQSKTALMAQLERDVDLLHRCNVLDYSLLVGVADMEMSNGSVKSKANNKVVPKCIQNLFHWMDYPMPYYGAGTTAVDGGVLSALRGTRKEKRVMYYMGVIDFLQPWTVKKRLERDLKGVAGFNKSAISCVAPADYAARFLKFVDSHVT